MLDFLENKIECGDFISYATRKGSSIDLNLGIIYKIENERVGVISAREKFENSNWPSPWGQLKWLKVNKSLKIILFSKKVSLKFSEKKNNLMIILSSDKIPQNIREFLLSEYKKLVKTNDEFSIYL